MCYAIAVSVTVRSTVTRTTSVALLLSNNSKQKKSQLSEPNSTSLLLISSGLTWGSSTTSLLLISPGPAKLCNFFVRVQLTSLLLTVLILDVNSFNSALKVLFCAWIWCNLWSLNLFNHYTPPQRVITLLKYIYFVMFLKLMSSNTHTPNFIHLRETVSEKTCLRLWSSWGFVFPEPISDPLEFFPILGHPYSKASCALYRNIPRTQYKQKWVSIKQTSTVCKQLHMSSWSCL